MAQPMLCPTYLMPAGYTKPSGYLLRRPNETFPKSMPPLKQTVEEQFETVRRRFDTAGHALYSPYQEEGVKWMLSKEAEPIQNRGGLLCDEMGLGKTIQMIATIVGNPLRKTLLIVPRSIIQQWESAIQTFASNLRVYIHHGPNKKRDLITLQLDPFDVCITSYGTICPRDDEDDTILHKITWDRVVLDECHNIKNRNAKRHKQSVELKTSIRWGLTGTPVQNSLKDFKNLMGYITDSRMDWLTAANLRETALKYILRRTKEDVSKYNDVLKLPPLHVKIVELDFETAEESSFYKQVTAEVAKDLKRIADYDSANMVYACIFEQILRLRQACIHPQLVIDGYTKKDGESNFPDWTGSTTKFNELINLIEKEKSESAIVFYQFEAEGQDIMSRLHGLNYKARILNGSTSMARRREIMTECPTLDVLVIQIQSGSEGINLQMFSRIFFTSPSWVPAIEDQAIARAHRIGQKKPVKVYKLVMKSDDDRPTIEQKIITIQEKKRIIMANVLGDERVKRNGMRTTLKDLKFLCR